MRDNVSIDDIQKEIDQAVINMKADGLDLDNADGQRLAIQYYDREGKIFYYAINRDYRNQAATPIRSSIIAVVQDLIHGDRPRVCR